jgi:hypothetical protein
MRRNVVLLALVATAALAGGGGVAASVSATPPLRSFVAEVWADNWFQLSVNGKVVGTDSVPLTTERSFNAERITFKARYPLTVALLARDFMETSSGLEYIGTGRQQIGDGGVVAQIRDTVTGKVVAATGSSWKALVVQRAPLDRSCASSSDPAADCRQQARALPARWTAAGFDDRAWPRASLFSEDEVGVKDGYDDVDWAPAARLVWSSDLELDNIVLLRSPVVRG